MIEIVVAVVGGSLTCITCASLWFASALDKREREEVEAERVRDERALKNGVSEVKIYPYEYVSIQTACQLCGVFGDDKRGPKLPKACHDHEACPAHQEEHLHMECVTCGGKWFMKPKVTAK